MNKSPIAEDLGICRGFLERFAVELQGEAVLFSLRETFPLSSDVQHPSRAKSGAVTLGAKAQRRTLNASLASS